MRLDYISYAVAIIFFIVTLAAAVYSFEQQQVWVVTTAVIGLAFIGLGYTQRPKATPATQTQAVSSVPPPSFTPPTITETAKKEETQIVVQSQPPVVQPQTMTEELMKVKGIKEKRAAQLKTLGINSLEDLAKASAGELAAKLQISPKFTEKWIANAKEIKERA
jgi:predicted flap endonuclease-1-like 5' DNA nuclease